MAGIIDIRYNSDTRKWEAQPRFVYDAKSFQEGAPKGYGRYPDMALYDLCDKVPLDISNDIRTHMDRRLYASPERDLGENHVCLDIDGHRPTPEEYAKRHADYLLQKRLGRDYRSVSY